MKNLAFALALTLSACQLFGPDGSASDRVVLEASFAPADSLVTMRLINRTSQPIGYNLCGSPIENVETGEIYYDPFVFCTAELILLAPGAEAEGASRFEANSLPSGAYRAVARVEVVGKAREVRSEPFSIP